MSNVLLVSDSDLSAEMIRDIAVIHRTELGGGFLSSLGSDVLETVFSFARDSAHGFLIASLDVREKKISGFILGSDNPKEFFREFLRVRFLTAVRVFVPKLLSLRKIVRAIETLLYPYRGRKATLPRAEVFDLAVGERFRGNGCGRILFMALVEQMRKCGVADMGISTGAKLVGAHRFYEKMGARKIAEFEVHRGETSFMYVYPIESARGPDSGMARLGQLR